MAENKVETDHIVRWRELAPEPEPHYCDCDYCEVDGDLDPVKWPTLVRLTVGGVDYVTDRFIALRADMAPIPEGYEGPALDGPRDVKADGVFATPATDVPPDGEPVRWSTMWALRMAHCRLRVIDRPADASKHARRGVAVVNTDGEQVGWAIVATLANDDEHSDSYTWPYSDSLANPEVVTPPGPTT